MAIKTRIVSNDGITQVEALDMLALTPEEAAKMLPDGAGGFEWRIGDAAKFWQQHAPEAHAEPQPLTMAWYAKQILPSIARLRAILARGQTTDLEAVIIDALRLGGYTEEAKWRFNMGNQVREGMKTHARRRKGGQTTGQKIAVKATQHDAEIRKLSRRWEASDELQDQYPSVTTYIGAKTKLPQRTIQRRLKTITRQ